MTISISELTASLNKAYRLISPRRVDLDRFKKNLTLLLNLIDEKESEENVKIHLMDFLKNTYYNPDHLIATKGKTDFVIHLGKDSTAAAGVLFEVKRPNNKADMVTQTNLNTKAMHELILYYLRERTKDKNNSLTHLVITNIYEWYIFDATIFESIFNKNKQLIKAFNEWENKQKVSNSTDHFYKEIAKPFLDLFDKEISFTHFDLKKFIPLLDSTNNNDDALIPLYKFFTPVHLLKLPFLNDSNSLDKGFFAELLHIIGLEEFKESGRKIIRRLPEDKRNPGSFIENTINILEVENALRKVPSQYTQGETQAEQLFNVSLELSITWINRILFLKLLEAQLIKYHKGDLKYRFLNQQVVNDYDELYKLFFQVLAKQTKDRSQIIQNKYSHIPYLNSSLFEFSDLEDCTFKVNALDDNLAIDLYANSVLKKASNYQPIITKNTLHYLFDFLDAYNFASIGKEEVQEENKTIINAAVLGLVFEKINGYKDGSIYTPGAVTTFLCRETIRKAVIKKFNDNFNWECESLADLKNYLKDKRNTKDILKFNELINDIKIADPAVGSGHFLVSSLNELISIKSELGVLADKDGGCLSEIEVSIANDELVVTYLDLTFFDYSIKSSTATANVVSSTEQRIQSTLFEEKRKIIEHCLFGVDINPNSVKICRLRLWIELLKHTYYKPGNYVELETLPNIDINIKQGNSLLSKYSLTEDLSDVFKKQKFSAWDYRTAVQAYKEESDKDAKEEFKTFIKKIKEQFHETVGRRDPRRKKLSGFRGDLAMAQSNYDLFGQKRTEKEMEIEVRRININIDKIEVEIKEIENNVIYRNAFEWRFEFPEVLNDNGDFEGFEVVIGNPPYIQLQKMGADADVLQKCGYETFTRTGDIYCLFYEQAIRLLKPGYFFGYITSNKWMRANYGVAMRKFLIEQANPLLLVDFGGYQVFESATVDTNMLIAQKSRYTFETKTCLLDKSFGSLEKMSVFISQSASTCKFSTSDSWVVFSPMERNIKDKMEKIGTPLKDWDITINYGIKTGYNEAFIIDGRKKDELISADPKSAEIIRPILRGRDIKRFSYQFADTYIIATFPSLKIDIEQYPAVKRHLLTFGYDRLRQTGDIGARKRTNNQWFETQDSISYWDDFNRQKIVWIELADKGRFAYDYKDHYITLNGTFIMIGEDLEYLCCILNNPVISWHFNTFCISSGVGTNQWRELYVKELLIPNIAVDKRGKMIELINQIILEKDETKNLQRQITMNQIVYEALEFTREEIDFIELQ
jgi:adenine-specific DNA-methyltransferase